MSTSAGQLTDALLTRIRDYLALGLATTNPPTDVSGRAFARAILTQAQRFVNAAEERVLGNASLVTNPYQTVYSISGLLPAAIRILDVRTTEGRSLDGPVPIKSFAHIRRDWFRQVGEEHRQWGMYGHDTLILYPAINVSTTLDVYYVNLDPALTQDSDLIELPDDVASHILDLAELLALIKTRQTDLPGDYDQVPPVTPFQAVMQRLTARYQQLAGMEDDLDRKGLKPFVHEK